MRNVNQLKVFKEIYELVKQVGMDGKEEAYKKETKSNRNSGEEPLLIVVECPVFGQTIHLTQSFLAVTAYNTSPCVNGACFKYSSLK